MKSTLPTLAIHNFTVTCTNNKEARSIKKEIFTDDCYYFEADASTPTILDIGAHIGISSLYFYRLYPQAHIVAVEPNPASYALLESNLFNNFVETVIPLKAAVVESSHKGNMTDLYTDSEGTWLSTTSATPGGWTRQEETTAIEVPAITFDQLIADYLPPVADRWDLVKLDIEGYELPLLQAATSELQSIKRLIVEAHDWSEQEKEAVILHLAHYGLKLIDTTHIRGQSKKLALHEFVSKS